MSNQNTTMAPRAKMKPIPTFTGCAANAAKGLAPAPTSGTCDTAMASVAPYPKTLRANQGPAAIIIPAYIARFTSLAGFASGFPVPKKI